MLTEVSTLKSRLSLEAFDPTDDGIVQQFQTSDLLPQVRAVLRHHERFQN